MTRISTEEEERLQERQKRLNTIHRNMMQKCDGDDSNCTTGPVAVCWGMDSLKKLGFRLAELLDADHWNNIEPLLLNIEEGLKMASAEPASILGPNVQTTGFDDNSGNEPAWHKIQGQIDEWAQQTLPPDHAAAIMSWSDRLAAHLAFKEGFDKSPGNAPEPNVGLGWVRQKFPDQFDR